MALLTDKFGREHDYLRISLLERCNLRCTYCMPAEGIPLRPKNEFMTQEELVSIASTFVEFGIKKIRLTGGEPLLKKNFSAIVSELSKLPVSLAITTNAILLDRYFDDLKAAGIKKLNISLDSLQEDRFNAISRRKDFKRIYKNITTAIALGFDIKLNVVLMKGVNDDEIIDFINLTKTDPIKIRFIEFMPFDGNDWDWSKKVATSEILSAISANFGEQNVTSLETPPNSTSKNYQITDFKGDFGMISTLTNPFCDTCNRIRLTADGKIKNCLFSEKETNILGALRAGESIEPLIIAAISAKKKKRAGITSFKDEEGMKIFQQNRSMTTIGG